MAFLRSLIIALPLQLPLAVGAAARAGGGREVCAASTGGPSTGAALALIQRPLGAGQALHGTRSRAISSGLDGKFDIAVEKYRDEVNSTSGLQAESSLLRLGWHRWTPPSELRKDGWEHFFHEAAKFEWGVFLLAAAGAIALRYYLLPDVSNPTVAAKGLAVWFGVAVLYVLVIWVRLEGHASVQWSAGYVLEAVFLLENVFVFHVVTHAFKLSKYESLKVLHVLVWGQIVFDVIFFMGWANTLRSWHFLPYILGAWLVCCGICAAFEHEEAEEGFDIRESTVMKNVRRCLGSRLDEGGDQESNEVAKQDSHFIVYKESQVRISLLAVALCVMLLADFLLEIDGVLTKIEEIDNMYLAFSSSAVATFAIPELFIVSEGLLKEFSLLKFGISIVLIIFGAQMLCSSYYVLTPPTTCSIVVGILVICVLLSALHRCVCQPPAPADIGYTWVEPEGAAGAAGSAGAVGAGGYSWVQPEGGGGDIMIGPGVFVRINAGAARAAGSAGAVGAGG